MCILLQLLLLSGLQFLFFIGQFALKLQTLHKTHSLRIASITGIYDKFFEIRRQFSDRRVRPPGRTVRRKAQCLPPRGRWHGVAVTDEAKTRFTANFRRLPLPPLTRHPPRRGGQRHVREAVPYRAPCLPPEQQQRTQCHGELADDVGYLDGPVDPGVFEVGEDAHQTEEHEQADGHGI